MREIKFRAWDKEIKKMGTPFTLEFAIEQEGYRTNGLIFMQFTGLHDRNGKEIYENDLLKDKQGCVHQVVFENGGFWARFPNGEHYMPTEEYRVIVGNIYENDITTISECENQIIIKP